MRPLYKIPLIISAIFVLISLVLLFVFGLNFGVDFRGGSLLEIAVENKEITSISVNDIVESLGFEASTVHTEGGFIIRTEALSEDEHLTVMQALRNTVKGVEERRFESVGPVIGQELKKKSSIAIFLALVGIVIYVAAAFRRLKRFLNIWILSGAAIAALFHDIILPIGVFVLLGKYGGVEIDAPMIAALLTIVGYSINDTVVVFDRARENFLKREGSIRTILHISVRQTLMRSINTTVTTLLVLLAIFFFGGQTLHNFSLALIMGIALGSYSSIFIATALLMGAYKT